MFLHLSVCLSSSLSLSILFYLSIYISISPLTLFTSSLSLSPYLSSHISLYRAPPVSQSIILNLYIVIIICFSIYPPLFYIFYPSLFYICLCVSLPIYPPLSSSFPLSHSSNLSSFIYCICIQSFCLYTVSNYIFLTLSIYLSFSHSFSPPI